MKKLFFILFILLSTSNICRSYYANIYSLSFLPSAEVTVNDEVHLVVASIFPIGSNSHSPALLGYYYTHTSNTVDVFVYFDMSGPWEQQGSVSVDTFNLDKFPKGVYNVRLHNNVTRPGIDTNNGTSGRSDSLILKVDFPLSVANLPRGSISVYPNPVTDYLQVAFGSLQSVGVTDPAEIIITDITGNILRRQKLMERVTSIDMRNYSAGIYLYRILSNGVVQKQGKVVKE